MVMSRKLAELQRHKQAPSQQGTRQGHNVMPFAPCHLYPTWLLRVGCFRCCYLPLTMKMMLCLLLTMVVLVILMVTSQKLMVIQQNVVDDYAISLNQEARGTNSYHRQNPVEPENRPSIAKNNSDEEQVLMNSNKTKHAQATPKPHTKVVMKATNHSKEVSNHTAQNRQVAGQRMKDQVAGQGVKDQVAGQGVKDQVAGQGEKDQVAGQEVKDKVAGQSVKGQIAGQGEKGEVGNEKEHGQEIKANVPPLDHPHEQLGMDKPDEDHDNLKRILDVRMQGPHVQHDPRKLQEKQEAMRKDRELQLLLQRNKDYSDLDEIENTNGEIRHVFFLKVHKAASTTVMNMMYRFAIKRHLIVMLPRRSNILSETNKYWRRNVVSVPQGKSHFDILCNHLIYNEQSIRAGLGKNAKFIGIVREPFQQFVSAFYYYKKKFNIRYLVRIPGEDPLATYLESPSKYEPISNSYTHNRMSFDFGMHPRFMKDKSNISSYINYLNKTFHLVMVSERFDESMVLLKRMLGWQLQDVLYIKNNVFKKLDTDRQYTEEQKRSHSDFNRADYALYEHFSRLFQARVENEGKLFPEEVATFVALREEVEKFCKGSEEEVLSLAATAWTPVFQVKKLDCRLMTLPESAFVNVMKRRQYDSRVLRHMEHMERFREAHRRRYRHF